MAIGRNTPAILQIIWSSLRQKYNQPHAANSENSELSIVLKDLASAALSLVALSASRFAGLKA